MKVTASIWSVTSDLPRIVWTNNAILEVLDWVKQSLDLSRDFRRTKSLARVDREVAASTMNIRITPIGIVVTILLAASLLVSLLFRDRHFQEMDSKLAYTLFSAEANPIATYVSWSYQPQIWGRAPDTTKALTLKDVAEYLPDIFFVWLGRQKLFIDSYRKLESGRSPPSGADEVRSYFLRTLLERPDVANIPLHGIYRLGLATAIERMGLPRTIEKIIEFPLASTYTPAMGLAYGFIYSIWPDYPSFMGAATFVTVIVLHMSALLLFFSALQLKLDEFAAAVSTILVLFSISVYSFGFHLGATVWTIFSFSLFFYFATACDGTVKDLKRLGILSGVLAFLSYLMVVPFIGLLIVNFMVARDRARKNGVLQDTSFAIAGVLRNQLAGIALIGICSVLFVQPGQGIRGRMMSFHEWPRYLYYAALNLCSWVNNAGALIDIVQFLLFILLVAAGAAFGVLRFRAAEQFESFAKLYAATLFAYVLLLLSGLLNFSPSRHILFFVVFSFFLYAMVLSELIGRFSLANNGKGKVLLLAVLGCLGLLAQQVRFDQVTDPSASIKWPPHVDAIYSPDNSYPESAPIHYGMKMSTSTEIFKEPGVNVVLYINQTTPFEKWLYSLRTRNPALAAGMSDFSPITALPSGYSFMAYAPDFGDERFMYNRPNSLYLTVVRLH